MAGLVNLVFDAKPVDLVAGKNPFAVEEDRPLLVGNTIHGIGFASHWFFTIFYRDDGIAKGMSSCIQNVPPVEYQDGVWEIATDKGNCLKWTLWKRDLERCMIVFRHEDGYEVRTADGVRQSVFEVFAGNPNGL